MQVSWGRRGENPYGQTITNSRRRKWQRNSRVKKSPALGVPFSRLSFELSARRLPVTNQEKSVGELAQNQWTSAPYGLLGSVHFPYSQSRAKHNLQCFWEKRMTRPKRNGIRLVQSCELRAPSAGDVGFSLSQRWLPELRATRYLTVKHGPCTSNAQPCQSQYQGAQA